MLAVPVARAYDVLHAVGQHAVPVAVVGAEARQVLAHRAQCIPQIGGRRIVGLEAHEHLAAAEEVDRIVIEPAMLVVMGVVIAGIVMALYLPLFQLTSVIGNS